MSDIYAEWERLRLALRHHVQSGRSVRSIAKDAGVAHTTIMEWMTRTTPPETIAAVDAVVKALRRQDDGGEV